eukprot:2668833-Rhodomonas_salina.2
MMSCNNLTNSSLTLSWRTRAWSSAMSLNLTKEGPRGKRRRFPQTSLMLMVPCLCCASAAAPPSLVVCTVLPFLFLAAQGVFPLFSPLAFLTGGAKPAL